MKNIKFKMLVGISIVVILFGLFSFINKAEKINGANIVTLQVIQQMDMGGFKGKISIIEPTGVTKTEPLPMFIVKSSDSNSIIVSSYLNELKQGGYNLTSSHAYSYGTITVTEYIFSK